MAVTLKLTCMVLICMSMALVTADAAITCGAVTERLAPCLGYLSKGGGVPPACCAGVRGLNGLARTTADRQAACRCLQAAARSMGTVNAGRAAVLPGVCRVRIPYPINLGTNCNNVK